MDRRAIPPQVERTEAVIYTLPRARKKSLEKARESWVEAKASDFERDGKEFVDKPRYRCHWCGELQPRPITCSR